MLRNSATPQRRRFYNPNHDVSIHLKPHSKPYINSDKKHDLSFQGDPIGFDAPNGVEMGERKKILEINGIMYQLSSNKPTNATFQLARDISTNEEVGVKLIPVTYPEDARALRDHLAFLSNLSNQFIARVKNYDIKPKEGPTNLLVRAIVEKFDLSLEEIISSDNPHLLLPGIKYDSLDNLKNLYYAGKKGIDYLSSKGLFHGNIKPSNFLFNKKKNEFKLAEPAIRAITRFNAKDDPDSLKYGQSLGYMHPDYRRAVVNANIDLTRQVPAASKIHDYFSLGLVILRTGLGPLPENFCSTFSDFSKNIYPILQKFLLYFETDFSKLVANLLGVEPILEQILDEMKQKYTDSRTSERMSVSPIRGRTQFPSNDSSTRNFKQEKLPNIAHGRAGSIGYVPTETFLPPITKDTASRSPLRKREHSSQQSAMTTPSGKKYMRNVYDVAPSREEIDLSPLDTKSDHLQIRTRVRVVKHDKGSNKRVMKEIGCRDTKIFDQLLAVLKRVAAITHQNVGKISYSVRDEPGNFNKATQRYELTIDMNYYHWNLGAYLSAKTEKGSYFSLEDVKKFMKDVMGGLLVLANIKIAHGNLNPNNIFYDEVTDNFLLADAGLLNFRDIEQVNVKNLFFVSPEIAEVVYKNGGDTKQLDLTTSDIYSLGMLVLYLLTNIRLPDRYDPNAVDTIFQEFHETGLARYGEGWNVLKKLLTEMLKQDPKARPNVYSLPKNPAYMKFMNAVRIMIKDKYLLGRRIDRNVYECSLAHEQSKNKLAIKIIRGLSQNALSALAQRYRLIQHISTKANGLVCIRDFFSEFDDLAKETVTYIVMDYYEMSLQRLIEHTSKAGSPLVLHKQEVDIMIAQVISALEVLRAEGIYHGNIKPSNILFTHTNSFKIVDPEIRNIIGFSDSVEDLAAKIETLTYCSPNVKKNIQSGEKVDQFLREDETFSLGLVCLRCVMGKDSAELLNDVDYLMQDNVAFNQMKLKYLDVMSKQYSKQIHGFVAEATFMDKFLSLDPLDGEYEIVEKIKNHPNSFIARRTNEKEAKYFVKKYKGSSRETYESIVEAVDKLKKLDHPSAVRMVKLFSQPFFDRGLGNEWKLFAVTRKLELPSAEQLAQSSMDTESLREVFMKGLRFLRELHSIGLKHGNIKPRNVFWDRFNRMVIFTDITIRDLMGWNLMDSETETEPFKERMRYIIPTNKPFVRASTVYYYDPRKDPFGEDVYSWGLVMLLLSSGKLIKDPAFSINENLEKSLTVAKERHNQGLERLIRKIVIEGVFETALLLADLQQIDPSKEYSKVIECPIEAQQSIIHLNETLKSINCEYIQPYTDIQFEEAFGTTKQFAVLKMPKYAKSLKAVFEERIGDKNTMFPTYFKDFELKEYVYQLLIGLYALHINKLTHGNIKPTNIFILSENNKKMIFSDCGLRDIILFGEDSDEQDKKANTLEYFSENIDTSKVKAHRIKSANPFKRDVYALGLIFLQLATLKPASYLIDVYRQQASGDFKAKFTQDFHRNYGPEILYIIELMTRPVENTRPTLFQLFAMVYLRYPMFFHSGFKHEILFSVLEYLFVSTNAVSLMQIYRYVRDLSALSIKATPKELTDAFMRQLRWIVPAETDQEMVRIFEEQTGRLEYMGHVEEKGRFHGFGRYLGRTEWYVGEWKFGRKEGYGKCFFENDEYYEGYWKSNVPHGKGVFYFSNGRPRLEGNFLDGLLEGSGRQYSPNGDKFVGLFERGLAEGPGEEFYPNGEIHYQGLWKQGKKNGNVRIFSDDGYFVKEAKFKDDVEVVEVQPTMPINPLSLGKKLYPKKSATALTQTPAQDDLPKSKFVVFRRYGIDITSDDIQRVTTASSLNERVIRFYLSYLNEKHQQEYYSKETTLDTMIAKDFKTIKLFPHDFLMELTNGKLNPANWAYEKIKHLTKRYFDEGFMLFDFFERMLFLCHQGGSYWSLAEINCELHDQVRFILYDSTLNKGTQANTNDILRVLYKFAENEIKEKAPSQNPGNPTRVAINDYMRRMKRSEYIVMQDPQPQNVDFSGFFVCGVARDIYEQKPEVTFTHNDIPSIRKSLADMFNECLQLTQSSTQPQYP